MKYNTEHLRNLLGSEASAQKFVALFEQQLPVQMETLRQSFSNADWETASNVAHALKSQCRYMGLDDVAALLQQLEDNPQDPQAKHWLAEVEGLVAF